VNKESPSPNLAGGGRHYHLRKKSASLKKKAKAQIGATRKERSGKAFTSDRTQREKMAPQKRADTLLTQKKRKRSKGFTADLQKGEL